MSQSQTIVMPFMLWSWDCVPPEIKQQVPRSWERSTFGGYIDRTYWAEWICVYPEELHDTDLRAAIESMAGFQVKSLPVKMEKGTVLQAMVGYR